MPKGQGKDKIESRVNKGILGSEEEDQSSLGGKKDAKSVASVSGFGKKLNIAGGEGNKNLNSTEGRKKESKKKNPKSIKSQKAY